MPGAAVAQVDKCIARACGSKCFSGSGAGAGVGVWEEVSSMRAFKLNSETSHSCCHDWVCSVNHVPTTSTGNDHHRSTSVDAHQVST